jgi:hypothetical protein
METKVKAKEKRTNLPSFSGLKAFANNLESSVLDKKETEEVVEEKKVVEVEKGKVLKGTSAKPKKGVKLKEKEDQVTKEVHVHKKEVDLSREKMEQTRITMEHRDILKLHGVLVRKHLSQLVWDAIEKYIEDNDLRKIMEYGKQV